MKTSIHSSTTLTLLSGQIKRKRSFGNTKLNIICKQFLDGVVHINAGYDKMTVTALLTKLVKLVQHSAKAKLGALYC